jgi:MFS family permease
VAGLIAEHVGWRWVFFGIVPLPIVAAALVLPVIRPLTPSRATGPSWRAFGDAGLLAVSMVLLLGGLGLGLIAGGIVGVGAALRPEVSPLVVIVVWTVAGLGVGLTYTTVQLITLAHTPPESLGRATSGLQLVHTVGITLATGIGGALVATLSQGGQVAPTSLAIQGALMLCAIVAALLITARLPA